MTEKWTDLSYEGKAMRKNFRFLKTMVDKLCKQKDPDIEKILRLTEGMSRMTMRQAKLVDVGSLELRTKHIENLLEHIPQHVIAEAKARINK